MSVPAPTLDVAIVGGSFAGISAALQLARARRQVCVVDAGAQGFVDLLEGIAEFVEGGPRAVRVGVGALEAAAPDHLVTTADELRELLLPR